MKLLTINYLRVAGGVRCNACRFDRCIEYGMSVETMKLPPQITRNGIEEWLKVRRKMIRMHTTQMVKMKEEYDFIGDEQADNLGSPQVSPSSSETKLMRMDTQMDESLVSCNGTLEIM